MASRTAARLGLGTLLIALGALYVAGAMRHGAQVNVSRVRADQSGYLWDAVGIYQDRQTGTDRLIGERNRMPIYPWLLSWLYDPALTPDQFFEKAKRWNTGLSLFLLGLIGVVARRLLPPLAALNLVLVVAFGYFVFKAPYAQVELLFYTVWLLMFVACWLALTSTGRRAIVFGAAGRCARGPRAPVQGGGPAVCRSVHRGQRGACGGLVAPRCSKRPPAGGGGAGSCRLRGGVSRGALAVSPEQQARVRPLLLQRQQHVLRLV